MEVLEHLVNPLNALQNLIKTLNPEGKLIVSLPNEFNVFQRIMILLGLSNLGGYNYHHIRFFNRKFAKLLFKDSNLKILGEESSPLIPLRYKYIGFIREGLKIICPELFAISFIWLVEPK